MAVKKTTIAFLSLAALLAFWSCKQETLSVDTETTITVKAA
jgi:hypothetical protein